MLPDVTRRIVLHYQTTNAPWEVGLTTATTSAQRHRRGRNRQIQRNVFDFSREAHNDTDSITASRNPCHALQLDFLFRAHLSIVGSIRCSGLTARQPASGRKKGAAVVSPTTEDNVRACTEICIVRRFVLPGVRVVGGANGKESS